MCQNVCIKNQDIYFLKSYILVSSKPSKKPKYNFLINKCIGFLYTYIIYFKKFGKNNVNGSLLSQHPVDIPNIAGVHGVLYGAW